MTYLPFKNLSVGAFFRDLEHNALFIKLDGDNRAALMESIWFSQAVRKPVLLPRGHVLTVTATECVIPLQAQDLVLPATRQDPVDPSRTFWSAGDTRAVGRNNQTALPVFAGLFLYSGMGSGYYFSNTGEVLFGTGDNAQAMADKEGIPFVLIDSDCAYSPSDLEHRKERARSNFNRKNSAVPA